MNRLKVGPAGSLIWVAVAGIVGLMAAAPGARAAASGTWQPAGKLTVGRASPQATLLGDGTVLVTGGVALTNDGFSPIAAAERFDPKTNQFSAVSAMSTARDDSHRSVRLADGRVLVTGGSPDFSVQLRSAELFDPAGGAFTRVGEMAVGRAGHTSSLLQDGRVLIAGGYSTNGPEASAELFDPGTGRFTKTGSMTHARYRHAAVALPDGRVAIVGGYDRTEQALTSVEIYDPQTNAFSSHGQLVEPRGDLTATLASGDRLIIAGGFYDDIAGDTIGVRRSVEMYDPATGLSAITDGLSDERADDVAVSLSDGRILLAGGRNDPGASGASLLSTVDLIDPSTGKVSSAAPMSVSRDGAGGVLLRDGRVLVLGGLGWQGKPVILDSAELFVP